MQKLKQNEFINLSENVLNTLAQNRITTILELLQEDVTKLSTLTKLTLPQILATRKEIFAKYSAPIINGATLLVKSVVNKKFLSTGIENLDAIMDGGVPIGYITEICGLTDSGKTQLSFQIAINCIKNTDNTVLYIDTKGDFSAVRIQKILDALRLSHKEMALIMYKLRIVHVWTMDELIELLKNLKNKSLIIENLALIIIDSLPCLMFQYLGDENKIGLSFLNTLVNYSRYLCKEKDIGIICVNIQTRWVDHDLSDPEDESEQSTSAFRESSYVERRNRCMGKYWHQIPYLVLLLEKCREKVSQETSCTQINVSVIKSTNMQCYSRICTLNLSGLGVT